MNIFLTKVGGSVSLFYLSPQLAGIVTFALPCMIGIGSLYTRYLRKLSKKNREEHTKVILCFAPFFFYLFI